MRASPQGGINPSATSDRCALRFMRRGDGKRQAIVETGGRGRGGNGDIVSVSCTDRHLTEAG